MSLKEHGSAKFGQMISRNVEQAEYMEQLVLRSDRLEMVAPRGMDIVCFRYNPAGKTLDQLNAINKEIKLQLEEQAIAVPGYTTLNAVYCIRMAISSHRSTNEDVEEVMNHIIRIGDELNN